MTDISPMAETTAKLIDVDCVAEICGCSPRTVYRLCDAGKMPRPIKLGALVRWKATGPGSIQEWIDSGCPAVRHISAKGGSR